MRASFPSLDELTSCSNLNTICQWRSIARRMFRRIGKIYKADPSTHGAKAPRNPRNIADFSKKRFFVQRVPPYSVLLCTLRAELTLNARTQPLLSLVSSDWATMSRSNRLACSRISRTDTLSTAPIDPSAEPDDETVAVPSLQRTRLHWLNACRTHAAYWLPPPCPTPTVQSILATWSSTSRPTSGSDFKDCGGTAASTSVLTTRTARRS